MYCHLGLSLKIMHKISSLDRMSRSITTTLLLLPHFHPTRMTSVAASFLRVLRFYTKCLIQKKTLASTRENTSDRQIDELAHITAISSVVVVVVSVFGKCKCLARGAQTDHKCLSWLRFGHRLVWQNIAWVFVFDGTATATDRWPLDMPDMAVSDFCRKAFILFLSVCSFDDDGF